MQLSAENSQKRREFLKNSLKLGAVAGAAMVAAKSALANEQGDDKSVLKGKSKKNETLYQESKRWKEYYSVAR